jgi:hypothetical protein
LSIASLIKTGLTEREWQLAWGKIAKRLEVKMTFDEWKQAVLTEGHNRRFISHSVTGKRCSLREGVKTVINEIAEDHRPVERQS